MWVCGCRVSRRKGCEWDGVSSVGGCGVSEGVSVGVWVWVWVDVV